MTLAVSLSPPNDVSLLKLSSACKPVVVLRPNASRAEEWKNYKFLDDYMNWLQTQLNMIVESGLYALVAVPITAFQTIPISDAEIGRILGSSYPGSILALYFTQGPCSRSDYWLRLYGAQRLGLRTQWVVEPIASDPKQDEGYHRDIVCDGAFGCYLKRGELCQPGVKLPIFELPDHKVLSKLMAALLIKKTQGLLVIPSKLWMEETKLWSILMKWSN